MEEIVRSFALFGGMVAVVVPSVAALVNQHRLFRTSGDHFVVQVDGKKFVFDVSSFDDSDVGEIDDATRAVEERLDAHV